MIGKEGHTSSVGFFPKIYKSKLMNILQNISVSKSECKDLKKKKMFITVTFWLNNETLRLKTKIAKING